MDEVRFKSLIRRAAANGALFENYSFKWNLSHDCEKPYHRSIEGRLSKTLDLDESLRSLTVENGDIRGLPLAIYLQLRCRKCDACKRAKRNSWSYRAKYEVANSTRNWFVTLTLGHFFRANIPMENRLIEMQKLVTKYFKRLRKNTGAKFRYLCVFELHKDGTPHAHLLLHDTDERLRHKTITNTWLAGFSQAKLIELDTAQKAVYYVVKYLVKDNQTRIRSSLHYGLIHNKDENPPCETPDPTPSP